MSNEIPADCLSPTRQRVLSYGTNYYLLGIKDAKEGIPAKNGMPDDYYRGYSTEYTRQQNISRGFN